MFKIIIIIIGIFINLIAQSTLALENKILLKINNEIITTVDIQNQSNYLLALNSNLRNLEKVEILEISKKSLIREKIKTIELEKLFGKREINNEILENYITNTYQKIGLISLDEFKNYLKKFSLNIDDIKNKIQIDLAWKQLIFSKYSSTINIKKENLEEEIKKNKISDKFYLLSEIVFNVENENDKKNKFEIIKKSISDIGFENTAIKYSISSTSSTGGKLDWINENSLNDLVKKEILKIQTEEITKPLPIAGGYLLLKLNKIENRKKEIDINEEVKKLYQYKINEQLNTFSNIYLEKIYKNIKINEF